jgi:hypothetical protein
MSTTFTKGPLKIVLLTISEIDKGSQKNDALLRFSCFIVSEEQN